MSSSLKISTRPLFVLLASGSTSYYPLPARENDPADLVKDWQEKCPELFKRKVYNLTGLDIYHIKLGGLPVFGVHYIVQGAYERS